MRTRVTFNGHELTQRWKVSDLRNPLLPREIESESVPGMDGDMFVGASLSPRVMGVTITVGGRTDSEREAESRRLAAILATDAPAPLALSINDGLYHMAVAHAVSDGVRSRNGVSYDVTFTAYDPVAYGKRRSVEVPSGGEVTFNVGGTYPTSPCIVAPSAGNGAQGYWRLTLDDSEYVIAIVPDGAESASVEVDCAQRVLRIAGDVALLDPYADWLLLSPGRHTLEMAGTGAATVTWSERWV